MGRWGQTPLAPEQSPHLYLAIILSQQRVTARSSQHVSVLPGACNGNASRSRELLDCLLVCCGSLTSSQLLKFRALSRLPQGKAFHFFAPLCCLLQSAGDTGGQLLLWGRSPSPELHRVGLRMSAKKGGLANRQIEESNSHLLCRIPSCYLLDHHSLLVYQG